MFQESRMMDTIRGMTPKYVDFCGYKKYLKGECSQQKKAD